MRRSVLIVLCLIVGAVLCLVVVGAILFLKDDPPPQINYTFRDLEVPAEVAASRPVLMRYTSGGTNSIEVVLSDEILDLAGQSTNLLPYAEEIETAWNLCTEGRAYVDELNQFPGITDWTNPDEFLDMLDLELPDYSMHQDLGKLYVNYAKLCTQQGNARQGIEVLSEHYAMIRKSLPYPGSFLTFVAWMGFARKDIETAAQILRFADLSRDDLELMHEAFSPLKYEERSLFRPILSEYVLAQYCVYILRDAAAEFPENPRVKRAVKPNRTLSILKKVYEPMLESAQKDSYTHQKFLQTVKAGETCWADLYSHQSASNALGLDLLFDISFPSFTKMYLAVLGTQVKSDLLALEIERRLGGTLELKDPFSGAAYLYNEERRAYFGVGEDGVPSTDDDIYVASSDD